MTSHCGRVCGGPNVGLAGAGFGGGPSLVFQFHDSAHLLLILCRRCTADCREGAGEHAEHDAQHCAKPCRGCVGGGRRAEKGVAAIQVAVPPKGRMLCFYQPVGRACYGPCAFRQLPCSRLPRTSIPGLPYPRFNPVPCLSPQTKISSTMSTTSAPPWAGRRRRSRQPAAARAAR